MNGQIPASNVSVSNAGPTSLLFKPPIYTISATWPKVSSSAKCSRME